jgi:hypothetical protein
MECKTIKETLSMVFYHHTPLSAFVQISHQPSTTIRPGRPSRIPTLGGYWDYGFLVKTYRTWSKVTFAFSSMKFRGLQQLHANNRQSSQGCKHSVVPMSMKKKIDEELSCLDFVKCTFI